MCERNLRIGQLARRVRIAVERDQAAGANRHTGELEVDVLP